MTVAMGDATMKTMIKIVVVEILTMAKIMNQLATGCCQKQQTRSRYSYDETDTHALSLVRVRRTGYLSLGHASHRQLNPCRNEAPGKDAKWRNSGD